MHKTNIYLILRCICPSGGIGRRVGLKNQWQQCRAGSTPASGTLGAIAQLARARDWQSRGQGFDSPWLHKKLAAFCGLFFCVFFSPGRLKGIMSPEKEKYYLCDNEAKNIPVKK